MDKEKKDRLKRQIDAEKVVSDIDDTIRQGNKLGLMKGSNESARAIVEELANEDESLGSDYLPLFTNRGSSYRVDEKQFALMFLEVFQIRRLIIN